MGYFGKDLNALNSSWKNKHESEEHLELSKNVEIRLFNYEIASNESSDSLNKVSKHCVIAEGLLTRQDPFFSEKYYFHVNR